MPWQRINDYVVIDCPEYLWELVEFRNEPDGDAHEQMMFVHIRVHKWSKSVIKQMKDTFRLFRQVVTCPLYAVCGNDAEDEKWIKFITHFGFEPLSDDVTCVNGEHRRLFWLPPVLTTKQEEQHEDWQQQAEDVVGRSPNLRLQEEAR